MFIESNICLTLHMILSFNYIIFRVHGVNYNNLIKIKINSQLNHSIQNFEQPTLGNEFVLLVDIK